MSPLDKIAATAPDHIWLDLGEEAHLVEERTTFKDLGGVTWSEDNATGQGIKYVRALASHTGEAEPVRECGNSECGWKGTTNRMLGSIGPLCPDCGETTEAAATPAAPGEVVPPMPETTDRRPHDDNHPEGYLESDESWSMNNPDALRWLADNHAAIRAALSNPAPVAAPARVYVECRECSNCGHIGINDDAKGMAACNTCDWNGPSPKEDHCPGCGRDGTMTGSCPECGHGTKLIAEARIAAPAPASEAVAGVAEFKGEFAQLRHQIAHWLRQWERSGVSRAASIHKALAQMHAIHFATPTPGDSADAPVQQAVDVTWAEVKHELSVFLAGASGKHSSIWNDPLEDVTTGTNALSRMRAALKGEQPVEPSGTERGEV